MAELGQALAWYGRCWAASRLRWASDGMFRAGIRLAVEADRLEQGDQS